MVPETEDGFAAGFIEASTSQADPEQIARELLRTASHDLRSPLTVNGFCRASPASPITRSR
jgi:signal transduction histidine kinase